MRLEFVYLQVADHRGPWKVNTVGYWYSLETSEERELLAYHWHPGATPELTFPHLHIGHAAQVAYAPITEAHLPTGHVVLEDVLRLAIAHFGVKPQRADWRQVLDETQGAYDDVRGW